MDHYECYDSFDWEVQCVSKPSSSFIFLLLHRELEYQSAPVLLEVLLDWTPSGFHSSCLGGCPLNVLSRRLGLGIPLKKGKE